MRDRHSLLKEDKSTTIKAKTIRLCMMGRVKAVSDSSSAVLDVRLSKNNTGN